MILGRIKEVVTSLTEAEKKDLRILAITLDPERDTPEILNKMAKAQQVQTPLFHFLTGSPKKVNQALDRYNYSRKKDPKTGIIDHVSLFILIDKKGKIAYQFTIKQKEWLIAAVHSLIQESKK